MSKQLSSPQVILFNSVYLRQTRLISGQKLHVKPQFKSVLVFYLNFTELAGQTEPGLWNRAYAVL